MPLPTRRTGESRGQFIGRCMGSEVMKREFPDTAQRRAVCGRQASKTPSSRSNESDCAASIDNLMANYAVRREMFDGRAHVVAPVVLITEGVHNGSGGPTFYPAEEIEYFAQMWNGVPLPVFHPEVGGSLVSCNDPTIIQQYSVGRLWNVWYDNDARKLRGEIWVDIAKAREVSPEVLSMIYEHKPLEVSTGLFAENDPSTGSWNGEQYESIARNIRPDHLALLPGGRGACSYEDGCGVRANKEGGDEMNDEGKGSRLVHIIVSNEDVSYEQLSRDLQVAVDNYDSPRWVHYLRAVYDDYFIYRAEPRGGPEGGDGRKPVLYQQSYSVDANGDVQLGGEPQEVKEVVSYKKISTQEDSNMANKDGGCCEEKVQLLIENEDTSFTEDDREWLSALTEEQIDKLFHEDGEEEEDGAGDDEGKTEVSKVAEETANALMGVKANKDEPQTAEGFIANAPGEIREVLSAGLAMHRAKKNALVKALLANKRNSFSEEELRAMDVVALEKLDKLAKADADYSGSGGSVHANAEEEEAYEMPQVNFDKDK